MTLMLSGVCSVIRFVLHSVIALCVAGKAGPNSRTWKQRGKLKVAALMMLPQNTGSTKYKNSVKERTKNRK